MAGEEVSIKYNPNIKEESMKKFLVLFLALALVAGFSTVSFAVISGSAHDFSGLPNARGEICYPAMPPTTPTKVSPTHPFGIMR